MQATLNRFEADIREKRTVAACGYLTPRSLREFLIGTGGKDLGNLSKLEPEDFEKGCAVALSIRTKGVKVPRLTVHIDHVDKEQVKGRYYLVAYSPRGQSVILNSTGKKIVIFAGPEEGE